MKPEWSDKELLHFVLEQPARLQGYIASKTLHDFEEESILYNACVMKVMVIGEYLWKMSQDFKGKHPELDWHLIKETRNFIAHAYDELAPARVWRTVTEQIPELQNTVQRILNEEIHATHQ